MRKKTNERTFGFDPEMKKTEWDMMLQEIQRLAWALSKAEEFCGEFINTRHSIWLERYYAILKTVYRTLFPILEKERRQIYKNSFKTIYLNLYSQEHIKSDEVIHEKLQIIHEALLEDRQRLGLGLRLSPKEDEEEWGALRHE